MKAKPNAIQKVARKVVRDAIVNSRKAERESESKKAESGNIFNFNFVIPEITININF